MTENIDLKRKKKKNYRTQSFYVWEIANLFLIWLDLPFYMSELW
jgi:hypothetical protein